MNKLWNRGYRDQVLSLAHSQPRMEWSTLSLMSLVRSCDSPLFVLARERGLLRDPMSCDEPASAKAHDKNDGVIFVLFSRWWYGCGIRRGSL
jgi:hypothetical protein